MDDADGDNKPLSLSPDQYTIGWICALPCELRAARAMLDQEHEDLPHQSKNDDNSYILGTIKQHNIAIPVLPQYGTSSATSTVKSMKSTFPNLRFVLMVGIGGGIPSKTNDIRLGDVVVSLPDGQGGGVIQYDLGREVEGEFHRVGVMNMPPKLLLSTVNNLRSEPSLGKTLSGYVEIAADKSEEPEEWTYLGTGEDQLFQPNYPHIPGEDDCENCCENAKPENLVNRKPRKATYPRLHYGNIGSGNTVMKTALKRDLIAKKENVICFDMEAAGLMNEFPCLVIRGISDYADSHKNGKWQPYAAVAAAAYARRLLLKISPQAVEQQKTIEEIGSRLEEVSHVVNKIDSMQRTQEHQAILDWLTPIDYALQQSHHFNRRQNGTGQWLLHSSEFKAWTETDRETLFCPGIPGAGKTILTSIVINDLMDRFQNDTSTGLAYIYCDLQRQEEQGANGLLANVLKQLAQCHVSLPESLKSLHDHHQSRRTRPSFDDIWSTLQSVSALFSKVFIVVDALDEFQSADYRTRILSGIFDLQAKYNMKLFATSRWVAEIVEKFEGSLTLPIRATYGDLKIYLDDRMKRLQSFIIYDPTLQRKIEARISDRADGMFLFAARLMDSLAEEPTEGHLNRALDSLPEKLNDTYEQAMERIETLGRNRAKLAKRILSWVIHAKRLLSTTEIRIAVAVEPGQHELEAGFVPSPETVGSLCAGLITIDTQRDVVRLAHQTTKEYFDQAKEKWFPSAESEIAVICVTYLSFNTFADGFCKTDGKFEERLQSHQLYDYAARNWGYHTRKSSHLSHSLKDFLACDTKTEASSQALIAVKYSSSHSNYSQQVPRNMTGLHLAAYFGSREVVEYLLAHGSFPNSRDSYYRTPLWWAAYEGHKEVVEFLLTDDRIEPDLKDNYQRTPMSWAAEIGHHDVVKLLLASRGVDPDSRDSITQKTPLIRAAAKGHEKVVRLLLAHTVDPDLNDKYGKTPLSWAAENGHLGVVKLLLARKDINLDHWDHIDLQTLLVPAATNGHEEVVRLLLTQRGVNPDSKDSNGRTSLSMAAENGHDKIVTLLLATERVNTASQDNEGRTPLRWAVEKGHQAIVHQLLFRKPDRDH